MLLFLLSKDIDTTVREAKVLIFLQKLGRDGQEAKLYEKWRGRKTGDHSLKGKV